MEPEELARLEHENMVEGLLAAASQVPTARIERRGGVVFLATGLPVRLFNQVLIAWDEVAAGAIEHAVSVMRERDERFVVNLRRETDDRCIEVVESLGLVRMSESSWMPGMAMYPLDEVSSDRSNDGHEIRRVQDEAGVRDHIEAASAGFGMPLDWIEAIVTPDLATMEDSALYVGYAEGRPVTTGLGIRTGRTIGVYNISTVEAVRRRGYGAAMTRRVIADGAAAGCDVAILQASDMGYLIYERMGFRTVVDYDAWVDPSSLAAED